MLDQTLSSNFPNVSFNTPAAPQGNWLQRAAGALGQGISNRPELFAIGADMIGRNLDPQNAFAGVGTHLAQGSLASKEKAKIESTQDKLMKLIEGLTGADQAGGSSVGFKKGKSGNLEMTFKGNLAGPTSTAPTTKTPGESQRSSDKEAIGLSGVSTDVHKMLQEAAMKSGSINSNIWRGGR
jgi:hypothetical protein